MIILWAICGTIGTIMLLFMYCSLVVAKRSDEEYEESDK